MQVSTDFTGVPAWDGQALADNNVSAL